MVASISARGSARAAVSYYAHLSADSYYTRDGEQPGRWGGAAAERLGLDGPVTQSAFNEALQGHDPTTGGALVQLSKAREHQAGWDMTFSAPKSVSVLWALSAEAERHGIEAAHREAVAATTRQLEQIAAWTRRGQNGRLHERTAGLLTATFEHHTSRESDPQLHTHTFVFNLAPRHDGTWGSIIGKELYAAQKEAGAVYRNELARGLERQGYQLDRQPDGFRVAKIPREVEVAFSKRRQAITEAAKTYGCDTAKGMELATLRTRRPKQEAKLESLLESWRREAKALGYELQQGPKRREREQPANDNAPAKQRGRDTDRLAPVSEREVAARRTARTNMQHQRPAASRQIAAPTRQAGIAPQPGPAAAAQHASHTSARSMDPGSAAQLGAALATAFLSLGYGHSGGNIRVPLHDKSKTRGMNRDKDRGTEFELE